MLKLTWWRNDDKFETWFVIGDVISIWNNHSILMKDKFITAEITDLDGNIIDYKKGLNYAYSMASYGRRGNI